MLYEVITTVDLGDRSYPIYIGQNLLQQALLLPHVAGRQVMIVSNETVAPLYIESLRVQFPDIRVDQVILPDGEQFKDLEHRITSYNVCYTKLLRLTIGARVSDRLLCRRAVAPNGSGRRQRRERW